MHIQNGNLTRNTLVKRIRRGFLAGIVLLVALIAYGLFRIPAALSNGLFSLVGAGAILFVFGLFGWLVVPAIERSSGEPPLHWGALCGLLAGLVYLATFLIEYFTAITGEQDGSLALVEFGSIFALVFIAALLASRRVGRIGAGMGAAMLCSMLSSMIWFCLLLITTTFFLGTAPQDHFFAINGTYSDFHRSGVSDLQAFVLQDFLGAGFFHTLLGLVVGGLLGATGGWAGRLLHR